jgi:flagellar hook-associated protein 3 FlgL
MALSSLGDLARSFSLRNQTTVLKVELERRSRESTTGKVSDAGRRLRGDFTQLSAIDSTLARLAALKSATSEADLTAGGVQDALATISSLSSELSSTLLSAASPGSKAAVDSVGQDAMARFRTAVSTLNTRVGDRTLFAGKETRGPALADADDMMDALVAASAGATSAADVETAVAGWFDDPAGFETLGYLGGAALDPLTIANGEQVRMDATAADPALRGTLKALAMAALLDRGVLDGSTDQRAQLSRRAGERLLESTEGRAQLAARIGTAQERIDEADTRNAAEVTALTIARSGILEVDDYEAASALTAAEAQLDKLYAITARLQRLSLAEYL